MTIQEIITELSNSASKLSDIKMQKVRSEITEDEAKKKCAEVLKKTLAEIEKAVLEWK